PAEIGAVSSSPWTEAEVSAGRPFTHDEALMLLRAFSEDRLEGIADLALSRTAPFTASTYLRESVTGPQAWHMQIAKWFVTPNCGSRRGLQVFAGQFLTGRPGEPRSIVVIDETLANGLQERYGVVLGTDFFQAGGASVGNSPRIVGVVRAPALARAGRG